MKRFLIPCFLSAVFLPATSLPAATTTAADDVKASITKLAAAPNYSWTITAVEAPPAAGGGATPASSVGPTEGKTEKGGFTVVTRTDNIIAGRPHTAISVRKGDKYVTQMASGWVTPEELLARIPAGVPQPPSADMAALKAKMAAGPVIPADELDSLAAKVADFKSADGVIAGNLSSDYIVAQLQDRLSGSTYITPPFSPKDISGTLKIWLKDGTLAKYEVQVKGTATAPGGRSTVVDYTVTTEIKDVGVTKIDVPVAAIAKLEGKPAPAPTTVPIPPAPPVPAPPLTAAQEAVLQGKLATFIPQLAANTGIKLVPVPAGNFTMGSPVDEDKEFRSDFEGPQTQVTLTQDFFLGATAVTQAQWLGVMGGNNPSHFTGDTVPVDAVSWNDAMAFCQKLTERERAAGRLPDGYAFTLPTEAQREYACRAGTTGPFAGDLDSMAWYYKNSNGTPHPVGAKQPNAWGLYDMEGNIGEWCADWFADRLPGGSVTDPSGPPSPSARITMRALRGGAYAGGAPFCRSAFRSELPPDTRSAGLGFRIALISISGVTKAAAPAAAAAAPNSP